MERQLAKLDEEYEDLNELYEEVKEQTRVLRSKRRRGYTLRVSGGILLILTACFDIMLRVFLEFDVPPVVLYFFTFMIAIFLWGLASDDSGLKSSLAEAERAEDEAAAKCREKFAQAERLRAKISEAEGKISNL